MASVSRHSTVLSKPDGAAPVGNVRDAAQGHLLPEEAPRHAEDTQAAAIRLLLFTRARSPEITGLHWKWIRGTRAVLPDSKSGPKKVRLPLPTRAVLNALPPASRFVFPNREDDGPMTALGYRCHKLPALAGLDDVRIHDCRHSFASRALALGEGLPIIGRLLGHRRVETTARYAHLTRDSVRESAERIAVSIAADILC